MGSNGNGAHPPEPGEEQAPGGLERWVPGPGWQRRAGGPLAGRRRQQRRRLRLVFAVAGAGLLLLAWSMAFSSGVRSVEPTVGDEAFVEEARDLCGPVRERIDAAAEAHQVGDFDDDSERAEAIEGLVAELEDLVDGLADLRPDAEDVEDVDGWLAQWDVVLDSGRRTADALADGDRSRADAASRDSRDAARAVNRFAAANGLPACGVPPG